MSRIKPRKRKPSQQLSRTAAIKSYNDGVQFNEQGDLSKAATAFRKALSLDPDFVEAHTNLGNVLKEQGKWKVAEKSYRRALALLPDNALLLSNLGNALYHQNNLDEALKTLEQAINLDPGYALAQHNLGSVLMGMNNRDKAIECFKKAYQLMPETPEIGTSLSEAMCEQGLFEDAASIFHDNVKNNPDSVGANLILANILHKAGDTKSAKIFLNQAEAIEPGNVDIYAQYSEILLDEDSLEAKSKIDQALLHAPNNASYLNLKGRVLSRLNLLSEAESLVLKSIAIAPDSAQFNEELGHILKKKGDYQQAKVAYLRAIKLDPESVEGYCNLAIMRGQRVTSAQIATMEMFLQKKYLTEHERMLLHFGLGNVCDGLGKYKQAFDHFSEANRKKVAQKVFNIESHIQNIKNIKEFCLRIGQKLPGVVSKSDNACPIFITGLPRTGKTVVENLLNLHPAVTADDETNDLTVIVNNALALHGKKTFPDGIKDLDESLFSGIRRQYIDRLKQRFSEIDMLTNTLPFNFYLIGIIRQCLPEAKIILCVRESKDTATAIYNKHFSNGHEYSYDPEILAEYIGLHQQFADFWVDLYPDFIHLVKFEHLIQNPDKELQVLAEFCGLEIDSFNKKEVKRLLPQPQDVIGIWTHYESFLTTMFDDLDGLSSV